jgi:hypothetical protein
MDIAIIMQSNATNVAVGKGEYMREADPQLVADLTAQFRLMDTDDSGSLELEDFPPGLALERTASYSGGSYINPGSADI